MDTTKTLIPPTRIAPETFLVHDHDGEGQDPVLVPLNCMVIRSAQPVVVDTGVPWSSEQVVADVFSLVDPEDVRWIYVSHDDIDHTGSVNTLMERCPNATLVVNWFMTKRMGLTLECGPERWRWLADGETLDVGDRVLHAVRPPIFDSPTTRGLFDPTTGVYWSSDCFATPMLTPTVDVGELDPTFWLDGVAMFDSYISPWLEIADHARFQRTVDRIEALDPRVIAGCHTPAITGANVARAIANCRRIPGATVPPPPDQAVLETIQRSLSIVA